MRDYALPAMLERGPVRAWLVDDTGLPKKGKLSVGVARQYCGQLGKRDNCQVAVTLSVATEHASLPIAYRLYLPEAWAADPARRAMAGVPEEVGFATKPAIALDQIRQALADGVPPGVVVTDAGYGNDTDFRDGVTALGLAYVAGIQGTTGLWPPGAGPLPAAPWCGRGRPPKRLRRDPEHQPLAAEKLARGPARGRVADRHLARGHGRPSWPRASRRCGSGRRTATPAAAEPRAEEWLLVEWPEGEEEPTQVLALDPARDGHARGAGRDREAALADRARLRGAEAGAGARPLRGPRLARLPPPRLLVHRRLRLPGGRALPLFPSGLATPARGRPSGRPATAPGAPPVRPERHSPASIATLRRHLARRADAPPAALPLLPASFEPPPTALRL